MRAYLDTFTVLHKLCLKLVLFDVQTINLLFLQKTRWFQTCAKYFPTLDVAMSIQRKLWDKTDVFTLISEWKLLPELWDVKHVWYRNRNKKQRALQQLATKFDTNTNEISRKLHNLRTQFHSEIRRIKTKNNSDGPDETHQSAWEFFDVVKFISSDHSTPVTTDTMEYENTVTKHKNNKITKKNSNTIHKDNTESSQQHKARKHTQNNETGYDHLLLQAANVMNKRADDFQIFGDYVASELRNLKSAENQRQLKLAIKRAVLHFSEIDANGCSSTSSYSSFSHSASQTLSVSPCTSELTLGEEKPQIESYSTEGLFGQWSTPKSETNTSMSDMDGLQEL